ncbi:MAG: hypothetical protein ACREQQ_17875, partial [Candidatus Binatia bacterium]
MDALSAYVVSRRWPQATAHLLFLFDFGFAVRFIRRPALAARFRGAIGRLFRAAADVAMRRSATTASKESNDFANAATPSSSS